MLEKTNNNNDNKKNESTSNQINKYINKSTKSFISYSTF